MTTLTDVARYLEQSNATAKTMLQEAIQQFFASAPEFKLATFTLYAPYFNDGEPCIPDFQSEIIMSTIDPDEDLSELIYAIPEDEIGNELAVGYDLSYKNNLQPLANVSQESSVAAFAFAEAIRNIGWQFFYSLFDEGQYVLRATGIDIIEHDHE